MTIEPMAVTWWAWLIIGLALMAAELLLPSGFFLFFFGAGGIVVGLLTAAGLVASFAPQGLAFILISALSIVLLRKPLLAKFHFQNRIHTVDSLVGQTAKTLEPIAPLTIGKVEMRGSCWSALNVGSELIPFDVRCRVEKVEGLTLHVKF